MANTTFKLRRSSVAGKAPNTSTISIGELAINLTDRKLYSSDGSAVFETGSNLTSLSVFSDVRVGNTSVNTVVNSTSLSIGSNALVNTSTLSIGNSTVNTIANSSSLVIGSVTHNSSTISVGSNVVVNTTSITIGNSTVNTVVNSTSISVKSIVANGGVGSANQILISNGTGIYWGVFPGSAKGIVQIVDGSSSAVATGTTTIPVDDTVPQNTEGTQFMSVTITPTNSSNKLLIQIIGNFSVSAGSYVVMALFQDSTAGALASTAQFGTAVELNGPIVLDYYMTAGTTSATTFKMRAGNNSASTITFNGLSGGRSLGGTMNSIMRVYEIAQ